MFDKMNDEQFLNEDALFGSDGDNNSPMNFGGQMKGTGITGRVDNGDGDDGGDDGRSQKQRASNEHDENRIFKELNKDFEQYGGNSGNDGNGGNGSNNDNPFAVKDDDDFAIAMLKQGGINPNAIPITDENGNETIVSFNDLTRQEQIDIMHSISPNQNNGDEGGYQLDDDEVDMVNAIRRSGLSPENWVAAFKEKVINDFIQNGGAYNDVYKVDSLSDDELWITDYHSKVKDATEEDTLKALEYAKSNPELFKRTVEGMRQMYKENEENYRNQDIQRQQELAKQRAEEYEAAIVSAVNSNSRLRFGDKNLELSDEDKEDIASFILDSDPTGENYMVSAMRNQNELVKMAFMYLKGEELIKEMQDSYRNEINATRVNAYKKGFEDAKSGRNQSFVVRRPGMPNQRRNVEKIAELGDTMDKDMF